MKFLIGGLFTVIFCALLTTPVYIVMGLGAAIANFFIGGYQSAAYLWNKIGEDMMGYFEDEPK